MTIVFGKMKLWVNLFEGDFSKVVEFKSNLDKNGDNRVMAANTVRTVKSFAMEETYI